jgi:amidase
MSALHDLTTTEQRDALRHKEISATELTEHYLGRIDRYGEDLGAFVEVTHDLARKEAAAADDALASGERGALTGIPVAFKDLFPVAGVRIRLGSAAVDVVPPTDGHVVGLLRRAGVVTVGTTHAPELGPTCFTHSAVVSRPAVTPYDTSRYASGSSGGAAAAVAAGLLPFGHASDGAGSIRTPAATCGLVGFKPSRGRLSPGAASFLSFGTEGPIARTVADAWLALRVMASEAPGLYACGTDLEPSAPRRLRVLRYTDSGLEAPDRAVVEAVDRTAELLDELGHEVVDGDNPRPWDARLRDAMLVVVTAAVASAAEQVAAGERAELLHPYTRWCVEAARGRTAVDFTRSQAVLAAAAAGLLRSVSSYDALLCPTTSQPPVPVRWFSEQGEGEACADRMLAWSAFTPFANHARQPAV